MTTTENGDPCEIIQGAREILSDSKRWGTHSIHRVETKHGLFRIRKTDTYCIVGALSLAQHGYPTYRVHPTVIKILSDLAGVHLDHPGETFPLTSWNDRPGRTHADVLALLDKAAETCQDGQHD